MMTVRELIADELGYDEIDVQQNTRLTEDLDADSLDLVELAMRIEEEYDIEMPDSDLGNLSTVGDVEIYVQTRSKDARTIT